jgi:hypothetical protein
MSQFPTCDKIANISANSHMQKYPNFAPSVQNCAKSSKYAISFVQMHSAKHTGTLLKRGGIHLASVQICNLITKFCTQCAKWRSQSRNTQQALCQCTEKSTQALFLKKRGGIHLAHVQICNLDAKICKLVSKYGDTLAKMAKVLLRTCLCSTFSIYFCQSEILLKIFAKLVFAKLANLTRF